ncbi:MAG: FlgD immunoglobulin-like domain containing protein, partial [Candidatus Zixiibacteriota bacterium]
FNVLGQRVERLVSGWLEAGKHDMEWSGQSSSGRRFSSGLYFYKLETGEESKTRKMMLLK